MLSLRYVSCLNLVFYGTRQNALVKDEKSECRLKVGKGELGTGFFYLARIIESNS